MSERGYASPAAFRRAATDRLRAAAKDSRWGLHELQRQLSYDRLLARLYAGGGPWIVKGATALIARGIAVRSTIDIDLYRERSTGEAEQELREACGHDLADWFSFRLGAGQPVNDGAGLRIPVDAYLGETAWSRFHIDLVGSDMRMTGEPEAVPPIAGVDMPQLGRHPYLAYPLIDHIADKICAILERYGALEAPSTRYKDLVDLVAILTTSSVVAAGQAEALRHEAGRADWDCPSSSTCRTVACGQEATGQRPVARRCPSGGTLTAHWR